MGVPGVADELALRPGVASDVERGSEEAELAAEKEEEPDSADDT